MRLSADVIEIEGERVSNHSKFYIWEYKLFEPVYRRGKKCKTYKAITDIDKINKIINRRKKLELIPTVSSVRDSKVKKKVILKGSVNNRFDILDIR